jgi:hypothetical protein
MDPAAGISATLQEGEHIAELSVLPARAGHNTIFVHFHDANGRPFDPAEVGIAGGNHAAGVEATTRAMHRLGPGQYHRDGDELSFPGVWQIEIRARIGDFDRVLFHAEVAIR